MAADLCIIGAGSAAFAAAIHAVRKDKSVVMVEEGTVGGTCVNVGCIPSKALLAAAKARHVAADEKFPGITTGASITDMRALMKGKDDLVEGLREDKYTRLIDHYGWQYVQGSARFVDDHAIEVDGRRIEADHFIIATGSEPVVPPIEGLADTDYLTSTTAMQLAELPESLIVLGGGYVGLEMAQMFARLGSDVTIITRGRIASREEPEVADLLHEVLVSERLSIETDATVTAARQEGTGVVVTIDAGREHRAHKLLVATGRRPRTGDLDLHRAEVEVGRRGEVVVDAHLRTDNPRVWAIGDVTGDWQFVYVAGAQGALAVDNALDNAGRTMHYRSLPRVTFTDPQIASVGLTEQEAHAQGMDCGCRTVSHEHLPRGIVNREVRGLTKVVAEHGTGKVVGIHMLADNAGDTMLAGVYAIEAGMTVEQMANLWCPYLTTAEGIKLAAQAFSADVAMLSCCAT